MLVGINATQDDEEQERDRCRASARALHPSAASRPEPLATDVLADIADGLALTVDARASVGEVAGDAGPASIRRERLLATEGYDAWLVAWSPGAVLEDHDHDGSVGVVHVLSGHLVEYVRGLEPGAAAHRLDLPAGSTTAFGVDAVHRLVNVAGTTITVQVFSPPLGAA